jgi:hypothetical protein
VKLDRFILGVVGVIGMALLAAIPVTAHHAFSAEFDADKPVKVRGTLVKVQWTNPHSWWHLDVKNENGEVERWMFEGGAPGSLARRGFTKDFVKVGTEIIIEGFLSKGIPRRANGRSMTYTDGKQLFMGSSGTGAPSDGRDPDEKP